MDIGIGKVRQIFNVVQESFPYDSPWKHHNIDFRELKAQSPQTDDFVRMQKLISVEEKKLKKLRESCYYLYNSPFDFFKELINAVHKHKVQNCGEVTRIAYAVARMNGIKHSCLDTALLTTKEPKDYSNSLFPEIDRILNAMKEMEYGGGYKVIDHIALQIHGKKGNEFVVDVLLNECNYKSEMEKIYKTKYGDIFKLSQDDNVKILNGTSENSHIPQLNDDEADELLAIYPELGIFKKTPSVKKNFFFDWFTWIKK
ncbi:hypothetical protein J6A31_02495 [bacterium]|nr:hypothetical protein [bacterium]